jgi:hypothetical protein
MRGSPRPAGDLRGALAVDLDYSAIALQGRGNSREG